MQVTNKVMPCGLYHAVTLAEQGLSAEERASAKLEDYEMFALDYCDYLIDAWGLGNKHAPLVEWFGRAYGCTKPETIVGTVLFALSARVQQRDFNVQDHMIQAMAAKVYAADEIGEHQGECTQHSQSEGITDDKLSWAEQHQL